ncbi:MAG TPA: acyl-CoA thioesterase [Rhabdochlamydiaceae bacterium]
MRKAKTVNETAVTDHTYKIFPNDLNSYGTVFGGLIMSILDRVALVVAERHAEATCVTVSVDSMHFLAPAQEGDILLVSGSMNRSWRSSMEIGLRVVADHYKTREKKHILSAYFTFVAVDKDRKPIEVPEVIPETPLQKRRFEEAGIRREQRKKDAEERRIRRQSKIS